MACVVMSVSNTLRPNRKPASSKHQYTPSATSLVARRRPEGTSMKATPLDLVLDGGGREGTRFLYEGGHARKIERGERLHQLPGYHGVFLVRAREVQNDARPQLILQMERSHIFTRVFTQLAHLRIGFRLQRHGPHLAQFLTTFAEGGDHALDVHLYRFQSDFEPESTHSSL